MVEFQTESGAVWESEKSSKFSLHLKLQQVSHSIFDCQAWGGWSWDVSSALSVGRKLCGEAISKCSGAEGRSSFQSNS